MFEIYHITLWQCEVVEYSVVTISSIFLGQPLCVSFCSCQVTLWEHAHIATHICIAVVGHLGCNMLRLLGVRHIHKCFSTDTGQLNHFQVVLNSCSVLSQRQFIYFLSHEQLYVCIEFRYIRTYILLSAIIV